MSRLLVILLRSYDFSFLTGVKKIAYEIHEIMYISSTRRRRRYSRAYRVVIPRREGFINFILSFFFSPRLIILFFFLYWAPLTLIMPVAIGYHRPFNFVWGGGCWKNGNYEKKSNTKKWTVIIRCLKLPGILTGSLKQNKVKKKDRKKKEWKVLRFTSCTTLLNASDNL